MPEIRLLDVVIPVYNRKSALERLLPDIQSWTNRRSDIHVYIVDDGSTDNLDDLFEGQALTERVNLIVHSTNKGRAKTRNTGLRAGSGKFVAFLDVDCRPDEGWIDRFIESLVKGYDGVFGNIEASGDSFWSDYSNVVYRSRADGYKKINCYSRLHSVLSTGMHWKQ